MASQVDRGDGDVDPDERRRQLQGPLDPADRRLQGDQPDHDRERAQGAPVPTVADEQEPDGHGRDAEDRRNHRVPLDDPLQGVGALEVEPLDQLALVVAGVGTRRGRDRPGEDRELAERDQGANRPDPEPIGRAAPFVGLVPRAPHEREGGVEQQHREDEVEHHQAGRQVVVDDERSEPCLGDHPDRQQAAEQGQMPTVRPAAEGEHAGGDHGDPDEAGEHAVAVLDHGVDVGRRHRPPVALGPVRATQPRCGQPDRRAGQDDQGERGERDRGDDEVDVAGDREARDSVQAAHLGGVATVPSRTGRPGPPTHDSSQSRTCRRTPRVGFSDRF